MSDPVKGICIPHPRGDYRLIRYPQTGSVTPLTFDEEIILSLWDKLTEKDREIEKYKEKITKFSDAWDAAQHCSELILSSGQTNEAIRLMKELNTAREALTQKEE